MEKESLNPKLLNPKHGQCVYVAAYRDCNVGRPQQLPAPRGGLV